jgi:carboxyl-terminal processing protease
MSRRCLFVLTLLLSCGVVRSGPAEPAPAKSAEPSFARHLWSVTDVVLDRHIDPPVRQQMLLTGVKALLAKSGTPLPFDLSVRISAVTTPEQFDALVKEVETKPVNPETTSSVIEATLATVPGRAHLFSPTDVESARITESNNYVGVGIQIRRNDKEKLAEIAVPVPGAAFRRAGGKMGDLIAEVDGKSMAGLLLRDVVQALRGPEGSAVTTLVRQPGSTETRLLKMVRETIPFQSALGYRRISEEAFDFRPDPTLPAAYIRLHGLSSSTYHELRRLERQLRSEGNRALVLDLRATPPGSLVHTAQVTDAFLDGDLMWKMRDSRGRVTEYKADRDCLFRDWPMVVLVNELTLETAAVIAESLQDRGRAVLVGRPTNAGGTVKSLVPLPDGTGGVYLTTGVVVRLKPTREPGIKPDHAVSMDDKRTREMLAWQHAQTLPEPSAGTPPDDPQLATALDLLREALKKKEKTAG